MRMVTKSCYRTYKKPDRLSWKIENKDIKQFYIFVVILAIYKHHI